MELVVIENSIYLKEGICVLEEGGVARDFFIGVFMWVFGGEEVRLRM